MPCEMSHMSETILGMGRIHQRACATAHLLKKIHPFKDFGGNIRSIQPVLAHLMTVTG